MPAVAASDPLAADYGGAAVGLIVRHVAAGPAVARLPPQRLSPPVPVELLVVAERPGLELELELELEQLTEIDHGNERLGTFRLVAVEIDDHVYCVRAHLPHPLLLQYDMAQDYASSGQMH